ncbi:hypothetical protein AVEN_183332-1 [Araneus ventricosus]|uniref:Uncharacterized protein n=1 Tax=Araneus ventricosus TaxID=182803 RepID=A0A4Y2TMC1_ARAVE|nr:hypothetical protein AVEN_183332-1 [Araneus ventricosus]
MAGVFVESGLIPATLRFQIRVGVSTPTKTKTCMRSVKACHPSLFRRDHDMVGKEKNGKKKGVKRYRQYYQKNKKPRAEKNQQINLSAQEEDVRPST